MSEPRIIRTVEEYEDLHTETVILNRRGNLMRAKNIWPHDDLPAVVVATGDQVRAARKALEGGHR